MISNCVVKVYDRQIKTEWVKLTVYFYNMFCIYSYVRYEVHTISFQTFFVWALLLIVHT